MKRHVADGGGEPDDADERVQEESCGEREGVRTERRVEDGEGGEEFDEHGREDDPGGAAGVEGFVAIKLSGAYLGEERVVDDLDEPDEAGHEEGGGELEDEERVGHLIGEALRVAVQLR